MYHIIYDSAILGHWPVCRFWHCKNWLTHKCQIMSGRDLRACSDCIFKKVSLGPTQNRNSWTCGIPSPQKDVCDDLIDKMFRYIHFLVLSSFILPEFAEGAGLVVAVWQYDSPIWVWQDVGGSQLGDQRLFWCIFLKNENISLESYSKYFFPCNNPSVSHHSLLPSQS